MTTRFFAHLFRGLWIIFVNKVIVFSQFKILIQRVASALKNETKNTVKYTEQVCPRQRPPSLHKASFKKSSQSAAQVQGSQACVVLSDYQIISKWFPNDSQWFPSDSQVIPKWFPSDSQVIPQIFHKWFSSNSQIIPKWFSSDSQAIPKWFLNGSQVILNWFSSES